MKAIVQGKYGSPDNLSVREVEKPVPSDNEILVRVFAATVNRTDCARMRAKPFIMRFFTGLIRPLKPVTGTDFAGQIEETGKDVKSFRTGDKVFGFDDSGLSSHAEYLVIDEAKAVAIIPGSLSFGQAAASLEGAHYALNFINRVSITKGQRVLVNGATGAIGSALLQLARYYGAEVTAVGSTGKLELLLSMGADRVIDYTKEDFSKEDRAYDFVFDAVGKSTYGRCRSVIKPGGVYISSELGPMAQNLFYSIFTPLSCYLPGSKGRKVIFPFPKDIKASMRFISSLVEEEKFSPLVDREYPLEKIPEAYRYVETGEKTGNVITTIVDKSDWT